MKTESDLQTRLLLELKHWFVRQCRNPEKDFYLYYTQTTAEHDGGIAIYENAPANTDCRLAWNERINKGSTIEQNFNKLRQICRTLPVLERGEPCQIS